MKLTTSLLWLCGLSIVAAVSTHAANNTTNQAPAMTSMLGRGGRCRNGDRHVRKGTGRAPAQMILMNVIPIG